MIEDVKKCVAILRSGGTILYPTDTIWGIGCDASNEEAVQKIFAIKNRPSSKSMIILVANPDQVSFYADVPEVTRDLVEFSEGPLTIIYPKARGIARSLIAEDGSIAIRVVKDEFCRMLINTIRKPLVSTSANLSGEPAPEYFDAISDEIKSSVDYVVNLRQHETRPAAPSRIMKIDMDGTIQIIR